jgi:hypothetical protein
MVVVVGITLAFIYRTIRVAQGVPPDRHRGCWTVMSTNCADPYVGSAWCGAQQRTTLQDTRRYIVNCGGHDECHVALTVDLVCLHHLVDDDSSYDLSYGGCG